MPFEAPYRAKELGKTDGIEALTAACRLLAPIFAIQPPQLLGQRKERKMSPSLALIFRNIMKRAR